MICSSFSWPNMFDVARGKVSLYNDAQSIVNRVKLMMLTDPTELYMNPTYGLGLRKHIFKYNNDNVVALIKDELIEQLRMWEPSVIPEETVVERKGPSGDAHGSADVADMNELKLTVILTTTYSDRISFDLTDADIAQFI